MPGREPCGPPAVGEVPSTESALGDLEAPPNPTPDPAARLAEREQRLRLELGAKFDGAAGDDGLLDLNEFYEIVPDADEDFARRLFRHIDADNSGTVTREEYLDRMAVLKLGAARDRLVLLFQLFDDDGSGEIGRSELLGVLSAQADAANLPLSSEQLSGLVDSILSYADKDCSGSLDLPEFVEFVSANPKAREAKCAARAARSARLAPTAAPLRHSTNPNATGRGRPRHR